VIDEDAIRERYGVMKGLLNERSRRRWAAAEARSHGRGGIAAVARATGISEGTVRRGLAELDADGEELEAERVRRAGAGRPGILEREPGLSEALDALIDPVTRGDPESPLRWTSKSGAKLAEALREMGHRVVDRTVLRLLKAKGYSLQANKKTREGAQHPDRDAQFAHINETVTAAFAAGEPVISVDAKKRELIGDFKAVGREFEPKGRRPGGNRRISSRVAPDGISARGRYPVPRSAGRSDRACARTRDTRVQDLRWGSQSARDWPVSIYGG
jgi:transposase